MKKEIEILLYLRARVFLKVVNKDEKRIFRSLYDLSVLAGVIEFFISQLLIKINLYLMILSVITGI